MGVLRFFDPEFKEPEKKPRKKKVDIQKLREDLEKAQGSLEKAKGRFDLMEYHGNESNLIMRGIKDSLFFMGEALRRLSQ